MFAPGTAQTRPEIYAMGFRNPFRMSVDKATGIVYLGDYGPDAGVTNPNRGPNGQVEFDRITAPGNFGWPYCTGTNTTTETYNDFQFPSGPSGAKFNCAGGVTNNSFRNTGLHQLLAAQARLDPVRRGRRYSARVRQRRFRVADGRAGLPVRRRTSTLRP